MSQSTTAGDTPLTFPRWCALLLIILCLVLTLAPEPPIPISRVTTEVGW